MTEIDLQRRSSYVPGLLVALGWYATLIAGLVVGFHNPPPTSNCTVVLCGPGVALVIAVIFLGGPFIALLVVTGLVLGPLHRRVSSPFLAGTLSVIAAVLIGIAVTGIWLVSR